MSFLAHQQSKLHIACFHPSQLVISKCINSMKIHFVEALNSQANLNANNDSWKVISEHPSMYSRLQTSVPAANPIHAAVVSEKRMMFPWY